MSGSRWFPARPDSQARGWEWFVQLESLLDRVEPMQVDSARSTVRWVRKGRLNLLEVTLRHRVEGSLDVVLDLSSGGATLYGSGGPDEFDGEEVDWPGEMFAEIECQLRESYAIENTFWRDRRVRTIVRTSDETVVKGPWWLLAAAVPRPFLRISVRCWPGT